MTWSKRRQPGAADCIEDASRDRRPTEGVAAAGWNDVLQILCPKFANEPRETNRESFPIRAQNRPQIDPKSIKNGSRGAFGHQKTQRRSGVIFFDAPGRKWDYDLGSFWGPIFGVFFVFGLRALFGCLAKSSSLAAFLRFAPFPFFGRPGCSLVRPRGTPGVPLRPPWTPEKRVFA